MLKILERSIALQLLVFYGLFLIPLLLGGVELYFFQRDALQQNVQRTDMAITQAIAMQVETDIKTSPSAHTSVSSSQLAQLTTYIALMQQRLTANGEIHIWVLDENGKLIASTDHVPFQTNLRGTLPGATDALQGKEGTLIASTQNRNWLYSYAPVTAIHWAVVVQRPTDVLFAAITSFQNSLLIALATLLIGASLFWFALHGWMVAPLAKLAQVVRMIKPDQTEKVSDGDLLARDRHRVDEIGQLIEAFSTMEDEIHTLFRKSDEKSQTRLRTLDAIMRSMEEGVLLERPDGEIMYANSSFLQFVGISPHELVQDEGYNADQVEEKLLALIENPDAYHEAIDQATSGNSSQGIAFSTHGYYNQLGQLVPVRRDIRLRLFQVLDQAGQLVGRGKIFRDVTRQNEAEQIKQNLLAIVSHELRTPLTSIKGYATSLLATDVELDSSLQEDFLRHIVEESDRMADLVTDLLEMSQLEAGTLKLSPSLHRLDTIVEQAIWGEERRSIHVCIPEHVPLLYVDRRRIGVVLRNLIENACCYAGSEAIIEITVRYEQEQEQEDRGLYLSIADDGPGLPPEQTERIFDRFYQIDSGRKRSSSGVGLGLAICRGFIEAHGGRIWAENRRDGKQGAVFTIWFSPKLLYIPGSESNAFELHEAL